MSSSSAPLSHFKSIRYCYGNYASSDQSRYLYIKQDYRSITDHVLRKLFAIRFSVIQRLRSFFYKVEAFQTALQVFILFVKVVQLYETMLTRHTTMVVGPTGGGKSVVINALVAAQTK